MQLLEPQLLEGMPDERPQRLASVAATLLLDEKPELQLPGSSLDEQPGQPDQLPGTRLLEEEELGRGRRLGVDTGRRPSARRRGAQGRCELSRPPAGGCAQRIVGRVQTQRIGFQNQHRRETMPRSTEAGQWALVPILGRGWPHAEATRIIDGNLWRQPQGRGCQGLPYGDRKPEAPTARSVFPCTGRASRGTSAAGR